MTISPYIEEVHEKYVNSVELSSKRLYDILLRVLAQHTFQGVLESNKQQIAQLDTIIRDALKESGYSKATDVYFTAFDKLVEHNDRYYAKEKLQVNPVLNDSQLIPDIKSRVVDTLRGGGINEAILKPLENLIRQEIFLNKTYQQTADLLRIQLIDKPILVRHVDAAAFDALRQYNGAIGDEVRKAYGLKYFYYIASIIENSRPLCDYIRDNFKGAISIDQLNKILELFCPQGIPSDKVITYETVNGVKITAKRGSGMYKGTTVENFSMCCGGHFCRHEVKWTRYPK